MTKITSKSTLAEAHARQGRLAALVIAGAMLLWMGVQFFGAQLGLPLRWVFLADFAALGAMAWALIVTFGIWRSRQRSED